MDKKPLIQTNNLCKTYFNDGEQVHANRNVNLRIHENEFTVIMGSSGSGKSTLLYLLSGLDDLTSGEIKFKDRKLNGMSEKEKAQFRRKNMGFVFQGIHLVSNLTLFENVVVPGYLARDDREEVDRRAEQLLSKLGLQKEMSRMPAQVSGGQKQRCAIAKAVINNPELVFADEPTGALNSSQADEVMKILLELNQEGQTILMVTHDIKIASWANRVVFLQDGRVAGELDISEYDRDNMVERERAIFSFLSKRGW